MSLVFEPEEAAKQAKAVREIHSVSDTGVSHSHVRLLRSILLLLFFIGFVFLVIFSTSAEDMQAEDAKTIEMLQGSWHEEFTTKGVKVVSLCKYNSDMTFTTAVALVFPDKDIIYSKLSGKWNVMASDLICEITETNNVKNFPKGQITSASILIINEGRAFYRLDNGLGFQAYRPEYMNRVWNQESYY